MSYKRLLALTLVVVILITGCSVNSGELDTSSIDSSYGNVIITSGEDMEYLEQSLIKELFKAADLDWNDPTTFARPSFLTEWQSFVASNDPPNPLVFANIPDLRSILTLPYEENDLPVIQSIVRFLASTYYRGCDTWIRGTWDKISKIDTSEMQNVIGADDWVDMYNYGSEWVYNTVYPYSWDKTEYPDNKQTTLPGVNRNVTEFLWFPSIYRQFFTIDKTSSGTLNIWVIGDVDVYMDPPDGTMLIWDAGEKPRCYLGRIEGKPNRPTKLTISIKEIKAGTHCLYFVHRANYQASHFSLLHTFSVQPFAAQVSASGTDLSNCDCTPLASNETAEYLVHSPYTPAGIALWIPGTFEYVLGIWEPVKIIQNKNADALPAFWDVSPKEYYNRCASWIYTLANPNAIPPIPPPPPGPPFDKGFTWDRNQAFETNIYRQVVSVDKDCDVVLNLNTEDYVDVYLDPFIDIDTPATSTPLVLGVPLGTPYHVGNSNQSHNISFHLSKGTHTLYFLHQNAHPVMPAAHPYGLIYYLKIQK